MDFEVDTPWKPPKPVLYESPNDPNYSMDFSTLLKKMEASQVDIPSEEKAHRWIGKPSTTEAIPHFNAEAKPRSSAVSSLVDRMEDDAKRRYESRQRAELFKEAAQLSELPIFKATSETQGVYSRLSLDSQRRSLSAAKLASFLEVANTPKIEAKVIDRKTEVKLVSRLTREG